MILWLFACIQEPDCSKPGACATDDPVGTDTDDTGTAGGDDTAADTEDPATVSDVLGALPACELGSTDGTLDLNAGCADGACAGMTYLEIVDALGEEGECERFSFESGSYSSSVADCSWNDGVSASFDDLDEDGIPDDGAITYDIGVASPFAGGTDDGLGVGASFSCFVAALGDPDDVTFDLVDKDWVVSSASWNLQGLRAYDYYGDRGSYDPDGYVDILYLEGLQGEL
jgi:hypothetical protein